MLGGHHRYSRRHRLHQHDGAALLIATFGCDAGRQQNIRTTEQIHNLRSPLPADQLDCVRDPQVPDQVLDTPAKRSVAHDGVRQVAPGLGQRGNRTKSVFNTLLGDETGDRQDPQRLTNSVTGSRPSMLGSICTEPMGCRCTSSG